LEVPVLRAVKIHSIGLVIILAVVIDSIKTCQSRLK